MAATGASPTYFNYDNFEEIQIATAGQDIKQPTGGLGVNLVVKRGTNQFRGMARGYFDNDTLSSSNVPAELSLQGVTPETADHNKQISDYGFDVGGPILKDKAWFYGLVLHPGHPARAAGWEPDRSHATQGPGREAELAGHQQGHDQLPVFRRLQDQRRPESWHDRYPLRRAVGHVSSRQRVHELPVAWALEDGRRPSDQLPTCSCRPSMRTTTPGSP